MAGKLTLKNQLIEELMEAASFYSNFTEDLDKIIKLIDSNEEIDHVNDKIRNEVTSFLLKGLESYDAKAYEDVNRCLHAAIQKLHSQELLDWKDDRPRIDARIKLALIREKAIVNKDKLIQLLGRLKNKK